MGIGDVFYVVYYCVEENDCYIDYDIDVDVYFKEVCKYYVDIVYLFCYISEGNKNGIEYGDYMCGFGVVMIFDKIWYGKFIEFM